MTPTVGEAQTWYLGKREPVVTVRFGSAEYVLSMADMIRCCQDRANARRVLQGLAGLSEEPLSRREADEGASLLMAQCQQVRRWKAPSDIKPDKRRA